MPTDYISKSALSQSGWSPFAHTLIQSYLNLKIFNQSMDKNVHHILTNSKHVLATVDVDKSKLEISEKKQTIFKIFTRPARSPTRHDKKKMDFPVLHVHLVNFLAHIYIAYINAQSFCKIYNLTRIIS